MEERMGGREGGGQVGFHFLSTYCVSSLALISPVGARDHLTPLFRYGTEAWRPEVTCPRSYTK